MVDPQPLATALRLDRQFQKVLFEVEQRIPHLSRHYQKRIKKWMQCLAQPISNNTWKRTRNQYCQLLLYQLVDKGRLTEPFNSEPQMGPLQNLPANALTEWRSSQRSTSRWRTQSSGPTTGTDCARNCNSSSPAGGPPCCRSFMMPSYSFLGARPGEVLERSALARSSQPVCCRSMDGDLGCTQKHKFPADSRNTGTSPVLFERRGLSTAVDASAAVAAGSYSIPERQAHSAPRKAHRTGGSAHYMDMQRKVQQCQDVLRRQTIHAQARSNRQPLGALGDSLNLPQPVVHVDFLRSKTAAYDSSISPACPPEFIDIRQLQRPASPPALTRDSLKPQVKSMSNRVLVPRPRCTAPSSPGTYSSLTCSDDSSTIDPSNPSIALDDFPTGASRTLVSPSSESSPRILSICSGSPICLDTHDLSHKDSMRVIIPEVPDVEENQRILAAHLDRMKAAEDHLRRTTQLRRAV